MRGLGLGVLLVPLAGCHGFDLFKNAQNTLNGLTNPLVMEGIVLGVEPPDNTQFDLSKAGFKQGTAMTLFLADAASASNFQKDLVKGAKVDVSTNNGVAPASNSGDGSYLIAADSAALTYEQDAAWAINADIGKEKTAAALQLPPPAVLDIADQMGPNTAIPLDFTGMGYKSALIAVYDVQNGKVTFTNEPKTITEIYNMTHGATDLTKMSIPGSAFADKSIYAVGIAGMAHTTASDLTNMNTALSTIMIGDMKTYGVSTEDIPQTYQGYSYPGS